MPTQTPMIVLRVPFDIPLDPLPSPLSRDAGSVMTAVDVLIDVKVDWKVLPPAVTSVTRVAVWTLRDVE